MSNRIRKPETPALHGGLTDPKQSAKVAGLRYVSDRQPGIRRVAHGKSFRYVRASGSAVRDKKTLLRIRSLVIPPAWTDVWISPLDDGHLQATGLDARRRKQYRYHPRWREVRDENKYARLIAFAKALPKIRRRVDKDLARRGLPREKVLAILCFARSADPWSRLPEVSGPLPHLPRDGHPAQLSQVAFVKLSKIKRGSHYQPTWDE